MSSFVRLAAKPAAFAVTRARSEAAELPPALVPVAGMSHVAPPSFAVRSVCGRSPTAQMTRGDRHRADFECARISRNSYAKYEAFTASKSPRGETTAVNWQCTAI